MLGPYRLTICIKWINPTKNPNPNPTITQKLVPNLESNQWPPNPGRAISKTMVVIRATHPKAKADGLGSFWGEVIGHPSIHRGLNMGNQTEQRWATSTFP